MTVVPPAAPVSPTQLYRELIASRSTAGRVEVCRGPAYETCPPGIENDEPMLTLHDPTSLRRLIQELKTGDPTHHVVIDALPGISLVFYDPDNQYLGALGLLTPRWIRPVGGPYDVLLAGPILTDVLERLDLPRWTEDAYRALDRIEPALPAAIRPSEPQLEHAQSGAEASTLCGIPAFDVVTYRHTFRFGRDDCPICTQLIWDHEDAFLRRPPPAKSEEADRLTAAWERQWPGQRPIAHELRSPDRWVRFHSLPESKRYAENESEYHELLRRHGTVLRKLAVDPEVIVVTCSWSSGSAPMPRTAPVARASPAAQHWQSILTDNSTPEDPAWTHLFIERFSLDNPGIDLLLRVVADDVTAGVIIADPDLRWLYHPYDGGADVFAEGPKARDTLRAAHGDWLSIHPSGR